LGAPVTGSCACSGAAGVTSRGVAAAHDASVTVPVVTGATRSTT
jgi:hypothetical protein